MIGQLTQLVPACGGVAAGDDEMHGAQPEDGAPPGAAGAPTGTSPANKIQVVDDVDHASSQYPETPAGSSAFFWRGGLDWFVSASDGSATRDAKSDEVTPPRGESTKAYHVSDTNPGTALDLWAQLNHPQGTGVDLGAYAGIAFLGAAEWLERHADGCFQRQWAIHQRRFRAAESRTGFGRLAAVRRSLRRSWRRHDRRE
jgi:hypothetical protein